MENNINTHQFADYFKYYISLAEGYENAITALEDTHLSTNKLINSLEESIGDYAYAESKWTVKELLIHMIDTERVFCNRALRFARNDQTNLPGYDHDEYVNFCGAKNRTLSDIMNEFDLVRAATIALFKSFDSEMLERSGTANGNNLTVLAVGYIIAGHETHHINVLKEKYLTNFLR